MRGGAGCSAVAPFRVRMMAVERGSAVTSSVATKNSRALSCVDATSSRGVFAGASIKLVATAVSYSSLIVRVAK